MRPFSLSRRWPRLPTALLAVCVCATVGAGCASRVVGNGDGEPGDARGDRAIPDGGDAGVDVPYRDVPIQYDVYREDTCPGDAAAGVRMYNCDPFAVVSGCTDGMGCYPWIEYPATACGSEIYHADCMVVGPTPIDGFCTSGGECAGGLACFVTGSGNRCLQLCHIDGSDPQCPRGRVCEPTDLPDFGACD